jgi:cell shape-determining protein MreC
MNRIRTNVPGYEKDLVSKAVLSTDEAYEAYKTQRELKLEKRELQDEVDTLKSRMAEIESLLLKVLKQND